MDRPKLRDVAERAGVHPSTASRALNPATRSLVKVATVRRIDAAAATLGYQTNAIARSLRTRRSSTVGVLVPDLTNPAFPPTVRGIEEGLAEAGLTVLLANTDNDHERERRHLDALRSRQVDGLILATADHVPGPAAASLPGDIPVVLLYDVIDDIEAHSVVIDDAGGTKRAVAHLRTLGHDRIACLAGPQHRSPAVERLHAFTQAMGPAADPALVRVCAAFTEEAGAEAFADLLDSGLDFTAVVAASDQLALGVYDVLAERGLSCPVDYSVVGFHDVPYMGKLRPGLTTVHVPHQLAGIEAARLLLNQLRDPGAAPVQVRVPVRLVERGSTARPRHAGR